MVTIIFCLSKAVWRDIILQLWSCCQEGGWKIQIMGHPNFPKLLFPFLPKNCSTSTSAVWYFLIWIKIWNRFKLGSWSSHFIDDVHFDLQQIKCQRDSGQKMQESLGLSEPMWSSKDALLMKPLLQRSQVNGQFPSLPMEAAVGPVYPLMKASPTASI